MRRREDGLPLLVLLEFPFTADPDMALRVPEYTALLYRELGRNEALGPEGKRPAVLPVVLYNGESRWTAATEVGDLIVPAGPSLAPCQPSQRYLVLVERHLEEDDLPSHNLATAVVGLERSRSPADWVQVVEALGQWRRVPRDDELMRVFVDWMLRLMKRFTPHEEQEVAPVRTPGGGADDAGGTGEPMARAVDAGRSGAGSGTRTGAVAPPGGITLRSGHRRGRVGDLGPHRRPERLAEVGEWLVRCDTGEEFLARVGSVTAEKDPREG